MLLELCLVCRGESQVKPAAGSWCRVCAAESLGGKGSSVVYRVDQALSPHLAWNPGPGTRGEAVP